MALAAVHVHHTSRRFGWSFQVLRYVPMSRRDMWDYGVADVRLLQTNHVVAMGDL